VTEFVKNLPQLNIALLWGCVCAAVAVFAYMLYSVAAFRRTPADAARIRGTTAEVLWAIVPIAIVIAMATPAVRSMLGPDAHQNAIETAQQPRPAEPALPQDTPQKAFNEGAVPL